MPDRLDNSRLILRKAFTLVEVLVALSLVTIIGTLAFLVLESTRQVSENVQTLPRHPLEEPSATLRYELDHLLPDPHPRELTSLALTEGKQLHFTTLLTSDEGDTQPVRISYRTEKREFLRIQTRYPSMISTTNRIQQVSSPVTFAVWNGETWTGEWPPEGENPARPPPRLSLTATVEDAEPFRREYYLPASYRAESEASIR